MNQDIVLKTILSRRSVRVYSGETVGRDVLLRLVEAGSAAPTARDKRHFVFFVIDDRDLLTRLSSGLPNAQMLVPAGHAIVVASDLAEAYGGEEFPYWIQDCAAATENILLAAESLGLGACWTGVHPREERAAFVRDALGLPGSVHPLCVIAVGIPKERPQPKNKFGGAKVFWNNVKGG
ncbi:MAG: nitroreductase family protein [Elusimicrobia bacterium]|nr:nitroreductase family protein [Elusimicrobiota bacterium]